MEGEKGETRKDDVLADGADVDGGGGHIEGKGDGVDGREEGAREVETEKVKAKVGDGDGVAKEVVAAGSEIQTSGGITRGGRRGGEGLRSLLAERGCRPPGYLRNCDCIVGGNEASQKKIKIK